MNSLWQVDALIELVRLRYRAWLDFEHPPFVADEIKYKETAVDQAAAWLNETELDRLIGQNAFDTILERLDKLAKMTNLLFLRVPSQGDTAVLHTTNLDKATFCTQFRNLLYADRPSPERLQTFSDYLAAHDLPNKWPFPTYYLFLCHPDSEIFVKPRAATWFLKFMGQPLSVSGAPDAETYAAIHQHAHRLKDEFLAYGARTMVDVQSMIWVGYREAKARIGRLDTKGQIELGVPQTDPTSESDIYEIEAKTAVMHESNLISLEIHENPAVTLQDIASETGFSLNELERWVGAIERKGQAVFYGPPGTGKTFIAERLAGHLIGGGDGFTELVQFHPAYAYEDFMQGIRPLMGDDNTLRYEMVHGRFFTFCQRAKERSNTCVFIIDEINRAHVAGVFGELMYLLEYRDQAIALSAGGQFRIPSNVRILATMNTADRSIALVDHALRRRFAFIHLPPNYELLRHYHQNTGYDPTNLIRLLDRLNKQINDPHYVLGTSFFMRPDIADQLEDIWRMEIEPYLEEHFFDQATQLEAFRWQTIAKEIQ
jgi:hypothetical protein